MSKDDNFDWRFKALLAELRIFRNLFTFSYCQTRCSKIEITKMFGSYGIPYIALAGFVRRVLNQRVSDLHNRSQQSALN